jgi:hypothetical protein
VPLDVLIDFTPGCVEYLAFVGWARMKPVRLTSVGKAVLKSAEAETSKSVSCHPEVIVLSPDDPMNAMKATAAVAGVREGLLVDPYFVDDLLSWLTEATSITRVPTCRREKDRRQLAMLLDAAAGPEAASGILLFGSRSARLRWLTTTASAERGDPGSSPGPPHRGGVAQ